MGKLENCAKHPVVVALFWILRWIPVLFIVAVVCWSYYAYVVELCIETVRSVPEKVFYLIVYHVLLVMFFWTYWQTIMSRYATPPKQFGISQEMWEQMRQSPPDGQHAILERVAKDLPILERNFDGRIRFCEKCKSIKPDRAHHCSVCGVCLLKMDHHCPWVNTCVHYGNYKYFVQFLGYAQLYCVYIALTDMQYFIWLWKVGLDFEGGGKLHVMILFFVAAMFGVGVAVLWITHLWLTAKNRATLETMRAPLFLTGPDKEGYNLGCRRNYAQVFGDRWIFVFLPIFSSRGDGVSYPLSPNLESKLRAMTAASPQAPLANLAMENEEYGMTAHRPVRSPLHNDSYQMTSRSMNEDGNEG